MMKIGELAAQVGVNPKTVRYYESIGVLPEPDRTPSGYRDYDATYAGRLTFIRTAQRLGITLDEVKEILAFRERGEVPCAYVRGVLDAQVTSIDRRIAELEELRGQLVELAAVADTLSPAEAGITCQLIEHVGAKVEATAQPSDGAA
jgi:DNA-binding transcriptional MerR regulator